MQKNSVSPEKVPFDSQKDSHSGFTLANLNDDCLMHICQFLPSKLERLMLADALGRLETLMRAEDLKHLHLSAFNQPNEWQIKFIFERLSPTLETLHIALDADQLRSLVQYRFPRVRDFGFFQWPRNLINSVDELSLTAAFPKLQTFHPSGNFTGEYLDRWNTLENLDLSGIRDLRATTLADILLKLRLKSLRLDVFGKEILSSPTFKVALPTLEQLAVNIYELSYLNHVRSCRNLTKLVVSGYSDHLSIGGPYGDEVHSLGVCMPSNLRSLTLVDSRFYSIETNLQDCTTKLSELNIVACSVHTKMTGSGGVIAIPPQLNTVNFISCLFEPRTLFVDCMECYRQSRPPLLLNIWPHPKMPVLPWDESDENLFRLTHNPEDFNDNSMLMRITPRNCLSDDDSE